MAPPVKNVAQFGVTLVRDEKSVALDVRLLTTSGLGADAIVVTTKKPALRGSSKDSGTQAVDLQPEEAVQLAAYLVAMAQLAGLPPAEMLFTQYLKDAKAAGQRHLAQRFPGFVVPPSGGGEPSK